MLLLENDLCTTKAAPSLRLKLSPDILPGACSTALRGEWGDTHRECGLDKAPCRGGGVTLEDREPQPRNFCPDCDVCPGYCPVLPKILH